MKKINAVIVAFMLLVSLPAFAEDEFDVSGFVEGQVRVVTDKDHSAKFQEYRDLESGGLGAFSLNVDRKDYFLIFDGWNVGEEDQSYVLEGGDHKNYGYRLFFDETPHNLSFDARSIYANPGHSDLTYGTPIQRTKNTDAAYTPNVSTNPGDWTEFDYQKDRKEYGGEIRLTLNSPYFLRFGVTQRDQTGMKPLGQPSGVFADLNGAQTSAFGNVTEMPEPIDYTTLDTSVETGYQSKLLKLSLKGMISEFQNHENYLNWRNPYVSTESVSETTSLPPDNRYYKVALDGSLRLPMNSLLGVRASYARIKNDFRILNTIASSTSGGVGTSPTYGTTELGLNRRTFKGDVNYTNLGLSLSGRPLDPLYARLYYTYLDKNNDSSKIVYKNGANSAQNHLFEYDKNYGGLDLDYKLPASTTASAGYEYQRVNREREDASRTNDHTFYLQLKNDYLETVSAKLRYQRLERSSEFDQDTAGDNSADPLYILRFLRPFDAADKTQDVVKLGLEYYPIHGLDLGIEYVYKRNDYDETVLGRTEDTGHEIFADVTWMPVKTVSVNVFGSYETTKADSYHRNVSPTAGVSFDPNDGTQVIGGILRAYNWSSDFKGEYWTCGMNVRTGVITDGLDLVLAWQYHNSDGETTFKTWGTSPLENIRMSDDYTMGQFEAKAIYRLTKNVEVTLGYLYEQQSYDDAQFDGYSNTVASASGVINTFLSGAYADHSYEENLGYFMVRYNF